MLQGPRCSDAKSKVACIQAKGKGEEFVVTV